MNYQSYLLYTAHKIRKHHFYLETSGLIFISPRNSSHYAVTSSAQVSWIFASWGRGTQFLNYAYELLHL
jgi:hypothetical protein